MPLSERPPARSTDPTWSEEFYFSELPGNVDAIKVTLMTHGKLKQDTEVGTVSISIGSLKSHVESTELYVV